MDIQADGVRAIGNQTLAHMHVHCDLRSLEEVGPFIISRGEGAYVVDRYGKRYLDAIAGMWCTSLGYSEKRLVEAAQRQMETLPYCAVFGTKSSDVSERLAEELISIAPAHLTKALFMNSGSEANDTALKIARYYNSARGASGKRKVITHERAYHGSIGSAAAATALSHMHHGFDIDTSAYIRATAPDIYRHGYPGEEEAAFADRLAAELERLIECNDPSTIGAMILEPVMGAGGVIVPPATYLNRVESILRRYDIILIADEIITGFGRTGNMFGSETYGIAPDIVTVAKGLSSGYLPISAVMMSQEIYEVVADESHRIGTLGHGVTYSAHPVSAAVALETLKIYKERDIVSSVQQRSPYLLNRLHELGNEPLVGDVRGVGLLGGVELVKEPATRKKFDPKAGVAAELVRRAQARGVLLRALGGDVVVFCPPLISEKSQIDVMMSVFVEALHDTARWLSTQQ